MPTTRAGTFTPQAICVAAAADSVTIASAVSFTTYAVRPLFITSTMRSSFPRTRLLYNHAAPKWPGPMPSPIMRMTFLAPAARPLIGRSRRPTTSGRQVARKRIRAFAMTSLPGPSPKAEL